MRRQLLEIGRIAMVELQEPPLDLRLRPGTDLGTVECTRIAMTVYCVHQGLTRRRRDCPERHAHCLAGRDDHRAAQCQHRIKHGAGMANQRPIQPPWIGNRTTAADKGAAVSLPAHRRAGLAFDHGKMRQPDRRIVGAARPAVGDQHRAIERFGFNEHSGEGRMGNVRRLRPQGQLNRRCQRDPARAAAAIGHRDPAHLGIVLRRNQHLRHGGKHAIAAVELGPSLGKDCGIGARLRPQRRQRRGPGQAVLLVSDINPAAMAMCHRVFAPAVDRKPLPAAQARARAGEQNRISAIGQQVHRVHGFRPRTISAGRAGFRRAIGSRHARLLGARVERPDAARWPLMQQQRRRPDHRLSMEGIAQPPAIQHIADGQKRHALMVRHVAANNGKALAALHPRRREVQSLIEAKFAASADRLQCGEVIQRRHRVHHRREACCVGCNDQIFRKAPLQPQPRHAEIRILIGLFNIPGVVPRFRNSPWHPGLAGIITLPLYNEAVGGFEQAAIGRTHQKRRHQILEHRA